MDRDDVYAATAQARRGIADLVDSLNEAQLASQSLCAGWTVKTVAGHLLSNLSESVPAVIWLAIRRRSSSGAIDELARSCADQPADEIAIGLRRLAERRYWRPPPRGHVGPLADVLVHSGDMRIPLGLPFDPDPDQAAMALDFLVGPSAFDMVSRGQLNGISLHATDIDQSWRKGIEVRGSAAALMMAAAGRTALLDTLDGPGLQLLRHRISL